MQIDDARTCLLWLISVRKSDIGSSIDAVQTCPGFLVCGMSLCKNTFWSLLTHICFAALVQEYMKVLGWWENVLTFCIILTFSRQSGTF